MMYELPSHLMDRIKLPTEYYAAKGNFKDVKTKNSGQFRRYCTRLCKDSLITGFPVIASTRSPYRRIMKALVFCICICGFLYQTTEFLQMYLEYHTMVDIQIENPDTAMLPAIGFCNRIRVRRQPACRMFPDDCIWYGNWSSFCSIFPRFCVKHQRNNPDFVLANPDIRKLVEKNRTFAYLDVLGLRKKDLIEGCAIKTEKAQKCENYVSVPAVNREGYPNKCFLIESLWGKPDKEPKTIPVTGQVSVYLALHPEEAMDYYDMIQAHIIAHDPHAILNPIKDGFSLEAGLTYNIYVSQMVTIRLPAPYETNCTDYLKLWRENGGYGPLTGKMCAEKCKMEAMLERGGCVPQSISYPSNNTLCSDSNAFPSNDVIERCSAQCSEACHDVTYSLKTEVKKAQSRKCQGDANCELKDMFLNFLFNRYEVTRFIHEPKFESVAVFSYIGGYIGMWLGISLVALFDFLETIFLLLKYPLTEWKNKKKKLDNRKIGSLVHQM